MSYKPTFSICIPNYNHAQYIAEAIQSVLSQSYENFEIVVVDNASTDNSLKIIQDHFNDPRIRVYRNNINIGFAPNLQRVTQYAKNDFINLLSADDIMNSGTLATLADIIMKQEMNRDTLVLYSQAYGFDNNGDLTSLISKADDGYYFVEAPLPNHQLIDVKPQYEVFDAKLIFTDTIKRLKNFAPFLTTVYSRKLWEDVEGYNAVRTIGPDKFFNFKLLLRNPKIIYIHKPLFSYRDYESSNRAAKYRTLRQPIDDYLYTIEYSDEFLQGFGLKRQDLIDTFIDRICLKEGLSQIGYRNYRQGLSLFAFALASYPSTAIHNRKFYLLLIILLTGPFGTILGPTLLTYYKNKYR